MIGNLYIIKNSINSKVYIGKTYKTIKQRFRDHISESYKNDRPLYKAINKHGKENFYIELLGVFQEKELEIQEIKYIEYFNSYIEGYNATKGGDGRRYLKVTNEQILETYTLNKNISETARKLGICKQSVKNALQNINTAKSKPIKILELDIEFNNTTEAAFFLIECEVSRTKNMRSVQREITKSIKYGHQYLGFTFKRIDK